MGRVFFLSSEFIYSIKNHSEKNPQFYGDFNALFAFLC